MPLFAEMPRKRIFVNLLPYSAGGQAAPSAADKTRTPLMRDIDEPVQIMSINLESSLLAK